MHAHILGNTWMLDITHVSPFRCLILHMCSLFWCVILHMCSLFWCLILHMCPLFWCLIKSDITHVSPFRCLILHMCSLFWCLILHMCSLFWCLILHMCSIFWCLMFDITHVSPILMFDNIRYYTCVIYLDFAPLLLHFVLPLAYIWISLTDHWLISLCCVWHLQI